MSLTSLFQKSFATKFAILILYLRRLRYLDALSPPTSLSQHSITADFAISTLYHRRLRYLKIFYQLLHFLKNWACKYRKISKKKFEIVTTFIVIAIILIMFVLKFLLLNFGLLSSRRWFGYKGGRHWGIYWQNCNFRRIIGYIFVAVLSSFEHWKPWIFLVVTKNSLRNPYHNHLNFGWIDIKEHEDEI